MDNVVQLKKRPKQVTRHYELGVDAAEIAYAANMLAQGILDAPCSPNQMKVLLAHAEACQNMAEIMGGIGKRLRKET
jgi:hypothetical protein